MLKRIITGALLLAGGCALSFAQEGILAKRPAGPAEGKILTMEEVILKPYVYPERIFANWSKDGRIITRKDGKFIATDPVSGISEEYTPVTPSYYTPEGASNITSSPDGKLCAYTLGNDLYLTDGLTESVKLSADSSTQLVWGQSVSRNEFGINGGIFWSDSGRKIAYYCKDESAVSEFPLLDIRTRTGSLVSIKYPMNGMTSEIVSLHIYDVASGKTIKLDAGGSDDEAYLCCITWSPDDKHIFVQVLDRSQKHLKLNMYRSSDGSYVKTLLTEDNPKWVEPEDKLQFIKGRCEFIYRTDNRDGFKNLYLCDTLGHISRVPTAMADVSYLANDGKYIYYTSAEVSPIENHLYRIGLSFKKRKGETKPSFTAPQRLTAEEGWHTPRISADCKLFIDSYSSFNVPAECLLKKTDGRTVKSLGSSPDPLAEYATGTLLLGTVKSADKQYDNYYRLFLPRDFDPAKKYPVIVYVYGGPHSQMVRDTWAASVRMWEFYMAQRGYIVYVQDNRGTSNRGAAFEKAIHRQCGVCEVEDQMEGIKMLSALPFVDKDRIGVHGWSYGGFMTISLMTKHPEVFKVGVAGGPVIDWKWYEIMYGERYMETEETNPEGFEKVSLMGKSENLKGKLLICQGAMDNTVVWQHSLNFIQECIHNGVAVDYFPYPIAEHNVFGKDRVHLMNKVSAYFDDYL